MSDKVYIVDFDGFKAELPILPLPSGINIAFFNLHGDSELTEHCAKLLAKQLTDCEVVITAESKGIPLIHAMSRILGENRYILARKGVKLYMKNVMKCETQSITTAAKQTLYIDGSDAEYMKGKRVLIVDDVISTGGSLESLENLVKLAGGEIVGKMTILAEGDAIERDDIIYLEKLPIFDGAGNPI